MAVSELMFLIALPISVAASAAWLSQSTLGKACAFAALIAVVCGLAVLASTRRMPSPGDLVAWLLVLVLPIAMALAVVRWRVLRTRRLVAATAAVAAYFVALLVGVNLGMAVGVLVH